MEGESGDEHVLRVKGWVLGQAARVRRIEIAYRPEPPPAAGERVIRVTDVRGRRADIEQAFPDAGEVDAHFEALVGLTGLTPEFELHLLAVLEDGRRVPIGSVRARHDPVRTGFEPRFEPLMVTCLGRTGSTLLMGALASHREIVVYGRFPYESSTAKHWMHALKVLAEPANFVQSSHPDTFHEDLWHVGHNPYYDDAVADVPTQHRRLGRDQVEQLAYICQQMVDEWYATVAADQDQSNARYFAEKHIWPSHIETLVADLYPNGKEVFLVRDFRDMACSILAFDEKRGFAGFGRPAGVSDEQYLGDVLRPAVASLYDAWQQRSDRAHLVRYEDLVLEPSRTLTDLLSYLELDSSQAMLDAMLGAMEERSPELEGHRTSKDARSSIARWRRDRGDEFGALCSELFGEGLAAFGYT